MAYTDLDAEQRGDDLLEYAMSLNEQAMSREVDWQDATNALWQDEAPEGQGGGA